MPSLGWVRPTAQAKAKLKLPVTLIHFWKLMAGCYAFISNPNCDPIDFWKLDAMC